MREVRVAAAQFFSGTDVTANTALCANYIRQAAEGGARLLVLPENSNRVRDYTTRAQCFEHSETLDGAFVSGLRDAARENEIFVAVGVDLRGFSSPDAFIASVLIGSDGDIVGVNHKHVLWDYEYTLFVAGDEPYQVFDTELGRLGLLLCADGIVPETPRALALLGSQILVNSLNSRGPDELRVHVPLRAMENRVWHVSANTVGGPADQFPWMGGSQVVAPDGTRLVEAGELDAELIFADIVPELADDKLEPGIGDVVRRRRPDLYGVLGKPVADVPAASLYGPAFGPAQPVTVAALQVSHFPNRDWTVTRALAQIEYAGRTGVQFGVLPEMFCFDRGEVAADPEAAAQRSDDVLARVINAAAAAHLHTVVNLVERSSERLFSTAFLIGPSGTVLHRYRKTHLRPDEEWATAGDRLDVVNTDVGVIGLLISDEIWVPEVPRVLAVEGAEMLAHPTDWDRDDAAKVAAVERSEENRVHIVSSTRLDSPSTVGSQVIRADQFLGGAPIALMRYPTGYWSRPGFEEQVAITLDLREARSKMMGLHLDPLATRSPHLYESLLAQR